MSQVGFPILPKWVPEIPQIDDPVFTSARSSRYIIRLAQYFATLFISSHTSNSNMLQLISKPIRYAVLCGLIVTLLVSCETQPWRANLTVIQAVSKMIYNIYFHPLRKYPGPRLWAASRLTWAHAMQSGNYHRTLHELHTQYGPVVRVAPDELSFINAEAWKEIYGNLKIPKSGIWTQQEEEHHPVSIVSTDEPTHLRNRRALIGAFTEHAIIEHSSILESLVGMMIVKFKEAAETGEGQTVADLADWFNFLTFDIGGALSFGESFDSVKNGRAHPWVAISCGFGKGIALMASINFFQPLDKLLKLAMPKSIMEKMSYHKQLAHEKFEQRWNMEHKTKTQDYIGSIATYNEEKGEIRIPKEEIEANMVLLIFAGSDTTSTAMTVVLNQLLQNPVALKRVQEEVRSAFTSEDDITVAKTAHFVYLDAVIREGIRMGPPAAISIPRVTPREGAMIAGEHVPGNVSDHYIPCSIARYMLTDHRQLSQ
jgi:cytochrome P450